MSGQDLSDMDLAAFMRWDVNSLKEFLRKRDLKVVGRKDTLAARAFSAWEMNIPEAADWKEKQKQRYTFYEKLLKSEDGILPDPFSEIDTWESEEKGMSSWPPIMLTDISDYLREHDTHTDTAAMRTRLLKDYKEQKAYSYFSSRWLFEIKYAQVSDNYCFLTAQCRPSQRLSNSPHKLWVCSSKDGKIKSAYCTCFAGLGQSCNHVAALLLKIDFCWRYGYVNKACTSKPCTWKTGSGHRTVEPQKVCDMKLKKPAATKLDHEKTINPATRKLFNPVQKGSSGMSFADFLGKLSLVSPESVILAEMTEREPIHESSVTCIDDDNTKPVEKTLPPSMSKVAECSSSVEDFLSRLIPLSPGDIADIEGATRKQAKCDEWQEQRDGSLTSSNFRDVYTRVESLKKKGETSMTAVTERVLGYVKAPKDMKELKYGRSMEATAIVKYTDHLRSSGHKNVSCNPCGVFVHHEKPYLRATPDSVVSCSCCGEGLLEVKCPWTSSHTKPSPETVQYLSVCQDGTYRLKRNTKYFDQIVGQLIITGRQWCDFFVFSMHGYHTERIYHEEAAERWGELVVNLDFFFSNYVAKELVHRTIKVTIMYTMKH